MADIDIDPIGEHESRPDDHTDENIPLSLVGGGWALWAWGCTATPSTLEPERGEQETSFRGGEEIKKRKLVLELCRYQFDRLPSPPGLTAGSLIFSIKIPTPGTAFQHKTPALGSKK